MIAWLFFFTLTAHAAIFGADDRAQLTGKYAEWARSTALQVPLNYVSVNAEKKLDLDFAPLTSKDSYSFCTEERFASERASPIACTGFLVAPDLLVTAGHCAVNWTKVEHTVTPQCEAFGWLFDYQVSADGIQPAVSGVDSQKLVRCKEVVYANFVLEQKNDHLGYGEDIALIRLERPVTDRPALSLASGTPGMEEKVSLVGYPLGLPAKSTVGKVYAYGQDFFRTDLDIEGGNSGSPVFNARGQVAGVLVRSFPDADYVDDSTKGCRRWNVCPDGSEKCLSGEDAAYTVGTEVQRIQALLPHLPR